MGTQERIGYRIEMSERRGFPWDPRNSHGKGNGNPEFDRNGNGNYSTGMGIGQFPLEGRK
jgi:hypothetical protein